MDDALQHEIDAYLDERWDDVIRDLDALVHIESVEDLGAASPGAPYGPGPRAALSKILDIAADMGLDAHDCEGHIGYADLPGARETQIGIIGHTDVVPAGPGWHFEPYAVTRKDGYLLGRGVADDKGPLIVALHAVAFWHDKGERLPYTIRVLFGANEETNMKDVAYYRAHHDDPTFLFTPDAEFPVSYGEAGICSGTLTSASIREGVIERIEGGVAVNAVPGLAQATLKAVDDMPVHEGEQASYGRVAARTIAVERDGSRIAIRAQGKSAHASTPQLGENAIDVLAEYLLSTSCLSESEETFLQLVRKVTSCFDGSGLNVRTSDEHFGELTAVGGIVRQNGDRLELTIDFRYPTSISAGEIEDKVNEVAKKYGARFEMLHDKEPFLMDPNSDAVQALLAAYNETTGEQAEPFTMKGGTYARVFTTGVSFGPEKPWEQKPDWVGSMHGPDEGIREDLLKQAFSIYVRTIGRLMKLDL